VCTCSGVARVCCAFPQALDLPRGSCVCAVRACMCVRFVCQCVCVSRAFGGCGMRLGCFQVLVVAAKSQLQYYHHHCLLRSFNTVAHHDIPASAVCRPGFASCARKCVRVFVGALIFYRVSVMRFITSPHTHSSFPRVCVCVCVCVAICAFFLLDAFTCFFHPMPLVSPQGRSRLTKRK
jgi:hypothetical protein